MPKDGEGSVEKKGVRGSRIEGFCEISQVAVNRRLTRILGWAGVWCDAVRLTEGVAVNTKPLYQ